MVDPSADAAPATASRLDHRVWYVAYGSNLAWARFRCYLVGGRPVGGARVYEGCRDSTEPVRSDGVVIPGGLVFAGRSRVWHGGMAVYDPHGAGEVAGRAHLLTDEQFADIAAQELRRPPGGEFARDLTGLLPDVASGVTTGGGVYETVVRLGERDGVPMFTITHGDVADLEPAAPSAPYLRWIAIGLREAHGYDAARTARYLATAPGIQGSWSEPALRELAASAVATVAAGGPSR